MWISYVEPFFELDDFQIVALTAYLENRGGGTDGMQSVINVIQNRALYDVSYGYAEQDIVTATGSKYFGVCLAYEQFSSYNLGNSQRGIALRLSTPDAFNAEIQTNTSLALAYALALQLKAGTLLDITGGANHYFALGITIPMWATTMVYRTTIKGQAFYSAAPYLSQNPQKYILPLTNAGSTTEIAPNPPSSVSTTTPPVATQGSTTAVQNPDALAITIPSTIIGTL